MLELYHLICYSVLCWVIVKFFLKLFEGVQTFILPNVLGEYNLIERFGSWAVVTGSTDGIGKGYAKELARRGLNIVLISRNAEKLQQTASEIESEFNVKTTIIVTDFCDGPTVYEHIKTELENIPVAILVNNVAMTMPRLHPIGDIPDELCWHMMYVNVGSVVMMTNLILPKMKKRKKGAIINISSASEDVPLVQTGLYSPSKALMKHFSQLLQIETESFGIEVQLVSPFFVKTNMLKLIPSIHNLNTFWIPDGETFARHAIKTLCFSGHTTGFWANGLWYSLLELLPTKMKAQVPEMVIKFFRKIRQKKSKSVTEYSINRR